MPPSLSLSPDVLTFARSADEIKTVIKRKNAAVATTAVAFHSSVLHSQVSQASLLRPTKADPPSRPQQLVDGVVQLRLNKLDPDAPPYDVPSTTQALWNALFKYFARGRDSPDKLEVEPVLPAEALDLALMELGALGELMQRARLTSLRLQAQRRSRPDTPSPAPPSSSCTPTPRTFPRLTTPLERPSLTSPSPRPKARPRHSRTLSARPSPTPPVSSTAASSRTSRPTRSRPSISSSRPARSRTSRPCTTG